MTLLKIVPMPEELQLVPLEQISTRLCCCDRTTISRLKRLDIHIVRFGKARGIFADDLARLIVRMKESKRPWKLPYGDGREENHRGRPRKLPPDIQKNEVTISVPEAGKRYFGLSRLGSYDAAKRGDIPTIKIGRLLKVSVKVMEKKLDDCGAKA